MATYGVWIGNLEKSIQEKELIQAFSSFSADIANCKVMRNEEGESKRFAFINFYSEESAENAAKAMNGTMLRSSLIETKGPSANRSAGYSTRRASLADCLYYTRSGSCKNGEQCIYRHSDQARLNSQVCLKWLQKKCFKANCPNRHPGRKETPNEKETQNEFERNIEKLLYDITSHKCSLDTLVPEYIKRFGTLDTTEYFGHQKLLNLLEAIPNTVQLFKEGDKWCATLKPVRLFACELKELLADNPDGMTIAAVNPAYKAKFQRDFVVGNYGFPKLITALEAIQDVVMIQGTGPNRRIMWNDGNAKAVQEQGEKKDMTVEQQLIDMLKDCELNTEKLLCDVPSHKVPLDTFVFEYIKRFETLDTKDYFGYHKLLSLLEAMPNTVQLFKEGEKWCATLTAVRLFACEIKELLADNPDGMMIGAVNPAYKAKFQSDFVVGNYGFPKLITALEAIQDVIMIEGTGPTRKITLKAVNAITVQNQRSTCIQPETDIQAKVERKNHLKKQKSWMGRNGNDGTYGEEDDDSQPSNEWDSVYGATYGAESMSEVDEEDEDVYDDDDEDDEDSESEEGEDESECEEDKCEAEVALDGSKEDEEAMGDEHDKKYSGVKLRRAKFCRLQTLNEDDSELGCNEENNATKIDKASSVSLTQNKLEPVSVFWDIENCAVPADKSAFALATIMRKEFIKGKRETEFMCACDITKQKKEVIEELNKAQVTVVHVSAVAKNAADDKLRQSLRRFADTYQPPCTAVLISGDVNFAPELKDLHHSHNVTITLVHNRQASDALKAFANNLFLFDELVKDLVPVNFQPNPVASKIIVLGLPAMDGPNHRADCGKVIARLSQLCDNCGGKVLRVNKKRRKAYIEFRSSEMALKAQKRMTGEDVFGCKISVKLEGNGTQNGETRIAQNRAGFQKESQLQVPPMEKTKGPAPRRKQSTPETMVSTCINTCDELDVKLLITARADSDLRSNVNVLRRWLNNVFHAAFVKADHIAFLWKNYSELHVLLKLDILHSASNQGNAVAESYQNGSLSISMARQFAAICCKAIQSICQTKNLHWEAEVCCWAEGEENGERRIRSNVIEVLLKQHCGYLSWKRFKATYSKWFGSPISELMLKTTCNGAVQLVDDANHKNQVVYLYEFSPLLRINPDPTNIQSFRNNLLVLLSSMPHKRIKLMKIVATYVKSYGLIPMSITKGPDLFSVICNTPNVIVRGNNAQFGIVIELKG